MYKKKCEETMEWFNSWFEKDIEKDLNCIFDRMSDTIETHKRLEDCNLTNISIEKIEKCFNKFKEKNNV